MGPQSPEGIEQALNRCEANLMSMEGITGVGITIRNAEPAILVMIAKHTPELDCVIPKTIEGYAVCVEEVGEVTAL